MSEYTIIYIEVKREIDFYFQMQHIESSFTLQMDGMAIVSAQHQFKFQNVHDISYKPFSYGAGILYLHTNQGVFSYNIKENPAYFIEAFKTLKSSYK
ncbi:MULTISPECIES: hypothetical protein [unclassified Psychrobacillus]|uniref:hypothetical protein n=1 Tax=unclassified Psychrobacillus TaxID=2636677 RepID=UPI00146AEAC6|nr:hypothetical protein [Psychrobacillus sp. BL-248-WT-3]NME07005.1 hypothetical protein [Psychrobacillus sp. BL-248-WT-3]